MSSSSTLCGNVRQSTVIVERSLRCGLRQSYTLPCGVSQAGLSRRQGWESADFSSPPCKPREFYEANRICIRYDSLKATEC